MRGPKPKSSIELTRYEKQFLEKVVRSYTNPHNHVIRAQIILLAHKGKNNSEIAEYLHCSVKNVRKWRNRFLKNRLSGLNDSLRSGAPKSFSP